MRAASIAAIGLASLTAGCSVPRPAATDAPAINRCNLNPVPLVIDVDPARATFGVEAPSRVAQILSAAAAGRGSVSMSSTSGKPLASHLILSGGGQHGSFGSGFLAGLRELPDYDVVTGVSTGALQAPLAMLGNAAPPDDRVFDLEKDDFPPWANDPSRRNIDDLVSGYTVTREGTLYRSRGLGGLVRRATLGDLEPLRKRIGLLITDKTLRQLAELDPQTRGLFIALLNWDSGNAEQIDMLALARDYSAGNAHARQCFIDVMVAASSEPLGTPPVMIDGHYYVDAGLRFGVFARDLADAGTAIAGPPIAAAEAALAQATDARVRAEARLEALTGAGTPKAVEAARAALALATESENAARAALAQAKATIFLRTDVIRNGDVVLREHKPDRYSALTILGRGRGILVNQVYNFSIRDVLDHAGPGQEVRFAYITKEEMDSPPPVKGAEFDPAYMERMLKLGRARGQAGQWNRILSDSAK